MGANISLNYQKNIRGLLDAIEYKDYNDTKEGQKWLKKTNCL
jgi:hypothetical protein